MRERVRRARCLSTLLVTALAGCADAPVAPPDAQAAECVSGLVWRRESPASALMNPGQACINCHRAAFDEGSRDAPVWTVAGTVFNAPREVNNCYGFAGSSSHEASTAAGYVEVTDATGRVARIGINRAGNFMTLDPLRPPLRDVRVVNARGVARAMRSPAPDGDCNGCHTRMGTTTLPMGTEAPGRVTMP